MRKLSVLFASGLLALGMAGTASAAVLNWEGTWTLDMADFGRGSVNGGGVATINSSSGVIPAHLSTLRLASSRGQVAGSFTSYVTDPETSGNGIAAIIWEGVQGGSGKLGPISGGAASTGALTLNTMPTYGFVKICLLSTACDLFLGIPFTKATTVNGAAGGAIEGIGIGGLLTIGGYGGIRFSLQQAPWTIKTATVIDQVTTANNSIIFTPIEYKGWAHAPASTTSSTAQPNGMVQLVTPQQVSTNLPFGSSSKVASGAVFLIRFIPEPSLLLLVSSGVVGLGLLGRRRTRS